MIELEDQSDLPNEEVRDVTATAWAKNITSKLMEMGVISNTDMMTRSLEYTLGQFIVAEQGGGKRV
eukprot:11889853-Karenia_brevis.AAC.1